MTSPPLSLRDQLALDRTRLAIERTILAVVRTSLGLVAAGGTLLHFRPTPWGVALAASLFGVGALVAVGGGVHAARSWRDLRKLERAPHGDQNGTTSSA